MRQCLELHTNPQGQACADIDGILLEELCIHCEAKVATLPKDAASVTITISREDAVDILMSEYACSECHGVAESLIAAVRAALEGER